MLWVGAGNIFAEAVGFKAVNAQFKADRFIDRFPALLAVVNFRGWLVYRSFLYAG